MLKLSAPKPVDELLAWVERLHASTAEPLIEQLFRGLSRVPAEDLPFLSDRLPKQFAWLLLYHPESRWSEIVHGLAGLLHHEIPPHFAIRVSIDPMMLEDVSPDIRPLVVGRLMLAVLNHQVPLTALPEQARLHAYLDEWLTASRRHALWGAVWEACYALARAIGLWRRTGFHPQQWECQTVIGSLPSQMPEIMLSYAHEIWSWAEDDPERRRFAGQWWAQTLKYLGADQTSALTLADLCGLMETAMELQPPFLETVQPDPEALPYITIDEFDGLFRAAALSWSSHVDVGFPVGTRYTHPYSTPDSDLIG